MRFDFAFWYFVSIAVGTVAGIGCIATGLLTHDSWLTWFGVVSIGTAIYSGAMGGCPVVAWVFLMLWGTYFLAMRFPEKSDVGYAQHHCSLAVPAPEQSTNWTALCTVLAPLTSGEQPNTATRPGVTPADLEALAAHFKMKVERSNRTVSVLVTAPGEVEATRTTMYVGSHLPMFHLASDLDEAERLAVTLAAVRAQVRGVTDRPWTDRFVPSYAAN